MKNADIRNYATKNNIKLWQVSEALGYLHESRFSRELRHELTEEKKQEIMAIIDRISEDDDLSSSKATAFSVTESISALRYELLRHGKIYDGFKASLKAAIELYCTNGLPFEQEDETAGKILDFIIGEEKSE